MSHQHHSFLRPPLQTMTTSGTTSKLTAHPDSLRSEILGLINSVSAEAVELIPESNFWGLAGYTMVAPEILKVLTSYALPQAEVVGATWNYVDAACQGLTGMQQLFDQATHRPVVTKTKGVLNLASSVQLLALTAVSATTLGPIGFAASFGVCFLLSLDEAIRQMRRAYSPEYFLVDSLTELDKIEGLYLEKETALESLQALPESEKNSTSGKLALKLVKSSLSELDERRQEIHKQLNAKLDLVLYEAKGRQADHPFIAILDHYNDKQQIKNQACLSCFESLRNKQQPDQSYDSAKTIDQDTKKTCTTKLALATYDSILWSMAFTGMLLACIPGMQIPAVALVAAASVLFLVKNGKKIVQKAKRAYRFFTTETAKPNSAAAPTAANKEPTDVPHTDLKST